MTKKFLIACSGLTALGLAFAAIPSQSARAQNPDDSAALEQRLEEMQQRLDNLQTSRLQGMTALQEHAVHASARAMRQYEAALQQLENLPEQESESTMVVLDGEGPSWLGVEAGEVTSEIAKQQKLPAERGVVIRGVTPDSPAAKAGLKENDVITEVDGQHVEGAAQFRRMIHEIPAGRSIPLVVWRDGRAQTLNVTLGKAEERHKEWFKSAPGTFSFNLPNVVVPDMPSFDFDGDVALFSGGHGRLGIDAEEIDGQLGSYFGAPDGEGILVRSVNSGSPAEKAGMKAGDVITTVNGERVRTVGDLREKLARAEDKPVKIGVLRNKSETTLTVELPRRSATSTRRMLTHRTLI
jgi:serine protease Do